MQRVDLPSQPTSPGQARAFVRDLLTRWRIDGDVREDAELLITELVTNAIIHAHSEVTVKVRRDEDVIRFSVFDRGPGEIRLRRPAPEEVTGRGLHFLDQIASEWKVAANPDGGKTVHFSLSANPSRSGIAL